MHKAHHLDKIHLTPKVSSFLLVTLFIRAYFICSKMFSNNQKTKGIPMSKGKKKVSKYAKKTAVKGAKSTAVVKKTKKK